MSDRPKIRNEDGTCSDAVPEPMQPGIDFEVYGTGPYRWRAYRGHTWLSSGRARTRLGLNLSLWWRRRRLLAGSPDHD